MSSSSASRRLPLVVMCAAFALSGCMQSGNPVAKVDAPRGSLDALAYGEMQNGGSTRSQLAEQGFFSRGSRKASPAATTAADASANVMMADAGPQPSSRGTARGQSSGGLLAAMGLRGDAPAQPSIPMEANAQIAPVVVPAPSRAPALVPVPVVYAAAPAAAVVTDPEYRVDAGDKLRIVVYGQEGLTNTYAIDAGGGITMPLIGRVAARGLTPAGLAAHITARLRKGFIREPSVAVEIENYRPFFILGEVAAPGQYPYVPNMSVEAAIAIAGGFSPRARRDSVTLTHKTNGEQYRETVPLGTPLAPGDTIMVSERWF